MEATLLKTITGAAGLSAAQLGRFGEPSGGWRIEKDGRWLCDCPHEAAALIMLSALGGLTIEQWANAGVYPIERKAA